MSTRNVIGMCLIVALLVTGLYWACGEEGGVTKKTEEQSLTELMSEAAKISQRANELGAELLRRLSDKQTTTEDKVRYVLALGKLKHTPAIPALIQHIDLVDPTVRVMDEADLTKRYPCVRALADFGVAAVPAIVDSYVREPSKARRGLLSAVIAVGRTRVPATTYARGVAATSREKLTKERIDEFIESLG